MDGLRSLLCLELEAVFLTGLQQAQNMVYTRGEKNYSKLMRNFYCATIKPVTYETEWWMVKNQEENKFNVT